MTEIDTTTTEGKIAVMQAHAGGAPVQRSVKSTFHPPRFDDHDNPSWDWDTYDYRVKPRVPREFWVFPKVDAGDHGVPAYPAGAVSFPHPDGILCREVMPDD